MNVWYINSMLGTLRLEEEDDALCGVQLCPDGVPDLEALPLAPKGTAFQKAVWAEMNKIPYGEVRTYGQLAAALGKPKAARAVGGACHCNPIAIIQPCHRVVGANGSLTGYAYGLEVKEYLLEMEQD